MAARWSGSPVHSDSGNRRSADTGRPEQVIEGHAEGADMDHSILALFEDSAAESEGKNGTDEDGAALLSALTEMLDNVAQDDDRTLSPFDTLPDTRLISIADCRDEPLAKEGSPAHRLRPRPKPPNATLTLGGDVVREQRCKSDRKAQKCGAKNKKPDGKVEVFSSSSLVSLVRLMHSYCLKLHVEERGGEGTGPALFSQEEVWRYEVPSEECDEEINVVSDDEAAMHETKEAHGVNGLRQLKSVLLKGNVSRGSSSKEKKRVSFGPVQVTSFEDSEESDTNKDDPKEVNREAPTISSEKSANEMEVHPMRGEPRGKSISLQQYRQLRRRRRPLMEKQGNYTTKWPLVSEPPTELTPILCLHGQEQHITTHHHPNSHKGDDHSTSHGRAPLKGPKSESKSCKSFVSPVKDMSAHPKVPVQESKRSPVKKPLLLCSDPPNPVLLPLPLTHSASPSSSFSPSHSRVTTVTPQRCDSLQDTRSESSDAPLCPQTLSSNVCRSPHDRDQSTTAAPQEILKTAPNTGTHTGTTSVSPAQADSASDPHSCSHSPKSPLSPHPVSPKTRCFSALLSQPPSAASHTAVSEGPLSPPDELADSGIEACDLTSLLEQFEETQAKEARVCVQSKLTPPYQAQDTRSSSGTQTQPSNASQTQVMQHPDLFACENGVVPEPLCTETILSTQHEQPRRTHPPSKAIQIIEPRPLPSKRTHTHSSEALAVQVSAHMFFYLSSEHDYCGPAARPAPQQSTDKSSEQQTRFKDSSPPSSVLALPEYTCRSGPGATTEEALQRPDSVCTRQTPLCSLPTPPPSPPDRGRQKRRYRRRSPRSDSSSSSCSSSSSSSSCSSASRSPKRPRMHRQSSQSSSCSSSQSPFHSPPRRNRLSYSKSRSSRSRSRSWSQSRSPSRSPSPSPPYACRRRWRNVCSSRESRRLRRERDIRMQKLKAIDERRVVYVGRIRRTMTHEELRERFTQFGEVECVSLHFRDRGDHYGFVTFYNMEDAFAAIDNGGKLRKPDELPFDICFGGRRQFCNSNYADLDANREADPSPPKSRFDDLDFDSLLQQAQRGLKR